MNCTLGWVASAWPLCFVSTYFQYNLAGDRLAQACRINQLFAAEGDHTTTILAGDLNPGFDKSDSLE